MTTTSDRPVALVTGGSRGLGHALVTELVRRGWQVITDGRDADRLARSVSELVGVTTIAGDIAEPGHRAAIATAVRTAGRLDLLVNNASVLGPLVPLKELPLSALRDVYEVNVVAPLSLVQLVDDLLVGGTVVNVSSDAAREPYETWGGYGSAKAALDQLSAILGVERPDLRVYAFDPGDMATDLQQQAFPGEDVSDRPSPESVVPSLLRLIEERPVSGRYTVDTLVSA